jgi:site-specific DNA recombinase
MERPALQRLIAEIRANRVDVVVTYKVDRLTRALADFARLIEIFDRHEVSFVSVSQQFNTTTSMGRLTLDLDRGHPVFFRGIGDRAQLARRIRHVFVRQGQPSDLDIKDSRTARADMIE